MPEPLDDWLTVTETAADRGVAENSVRVAIRTGRLPYIMKGGRYLIRRSAVDAWTVANKGPGRGKKP